MKEKIYTGYAVVSRDILDDKVFKKGLFGISLHNVDLETAKRYCHNGSIVARTYRVPLARNLKFRWMCKYPQFEFRVRYSPAYIQLWHFRIEWGTDYTDGYEREIIYEKEN